MSQPYRLPYPSTASDRVLRSSVAAHRVTYTHDHTVQRDLLSLETQLLNNDIEYILNSRVQSVQDDDIISHLHFAAHAYAAKITTKRALAAADRDKWLEAIKLEIDQLFNGGTLVEETPTGVRGKDYIVIHSTMQLKLKLKQDMTVDKYKARLCGRDDMLSGLIAETYSPTISSLARATALQLAILDNMHTCIVDTVGAYLYQDYPDDATPLYLKLEPHVAEALSRDPNALYRIRKYLYGLPDSG